MNFMLKKMAAPLVLFAVSIFAWFNAASLDSQSGKEFSSEVPDTNTSLITPLLSARRLPVFLQAPIADNELRNEVENLVLINHVRVHHCFECCQRQCYFLHLHLQLPTDEESFQLFLL